VTTVVCSGSKTKLLVVGTRELRRSNLTNRDLSIEIVVDGHPVKESEIINVMTWEHHLYDHKGLIQKLSQRATIIWKFSFMMPRMKLKMISEGIFFSLLNYSIKVYGNAW
jgi:hypothetical protein